MAIHEPSSHQWDAFMASSPQAHILQSRAWGELKRRFGWQAERLLTDYADGGAQILYRRAAGLRLAYVPRGPVVDWENAASVARTLAAVEAAARDAGCAILKLEPDLIDSAANRALLTTHGFTCSSQSVQPPSTIVVDLTGDDDAILARMKSKWRYNIRLAKRKGVVVRPADATDLPAFNRLMRTTGARDGFPVHSADYYASAYELFVPDAAVFLLAEYAGEPLGALVVFARGERAWYLWGASSNEQRNRMPNHALQWAAMQWARAHGARVYDLWGVPDALGRLASAMRNGNEAVAAASLPVDLRSAPRGELWGVFRFKQGFGGQVVRSIGAWDRPLDPVGFRAYRIGLQAQATRAELRGRPLRTWPATLRRTIGRMPRLPATVDLRSIEDASEWGRLLATLPCPHVLQSWDWGEFKQQSGWTAERVVLPRRTNRAAFQFLWRQPVAQLPARVGYVPKGPILDWQDEALVDRVLACIEAYARTRGALFVKIDPDVREDTSAGKRLVHALHRRGWRFSPDQIQFKNTAFTDLTVGEELLLSAMKSKWRYNIRLAGRRGIRVRAGGADDLDAFYRLYAETSARDGFLIRPPAYYAAAWRSFLAAQEDEESPAGGALLLAEHPEEREPVAGLFLLRYGARSWYFHGASSERRRRDMPNHLLQWEALRWSLAQDCTVYDWWGAPTNPADPDDDLQTVWRFKQGFGAELQPHIGAWDFPVQPALYHAYTQSMPKVLDWMRHT